jgi:hypothetical protein
LGHGIKEPIRRPFQNTACRRQFGGYSIVAVLPFESLDIAPIRAVHKPYRPTQLPFYVERLADDGPLSWLLRLATCLHVSMHTQAYSSFGDDDRSGDPRWWLRPHPWLSARVSERTGVPVIRL